MKKVIIISVLMCLLFVAPGVHAITASIQPGSTYLTLNITKDKVNIIPYNFYAINNNNFTVNVTAKAMGNSEIIYLQNSSFTLGENESQQVNFLIILTEDGNYSSDISVMFSYENQSSSAALSFHLGVKATYNDSYQNQNPPSKPMLISPANKSNLTESLVTLRWSSSLDSDNDTLVYNYQVDENSDFSSPISGNTPETEKKLELQMNKKYYWRIIANDGAHKNISETREFILGNYTEPEIVNETLSTPVLISPENSSVLNVLPLLNWSDVYSGLERPIYDLFIYNISGDIVVNETVNVSHYNTSQDDLIDNDYFWKVRARNSYNVSDFSPMWTFILISNSTNQTNETQSQETGPYCGDGTCNPNEDCSSCEADCGQCQQSSGRTQSSVSSGGSSYGGGGYSSPSAQTENSIENTSSNEIKITNQSKNDSPSENSDTIQISEEVKNESENASTNESGENQAQSPNTFTGNFAKIISENIVFIAGSFVIVIIVALFFTKYRIAWV